MKLQLPRLLLLGLFALAGTASATQMKTTQAQPPVAAAKAESPWPSLASSLPPATAPMLAHDDDRYWRDGRWHSHRDDWRREQIRKEHWRREQHRREMERRRAWERHHDGAMHHRYEDDHRYYRR